MAPKGTSSVMIFSVNIVSDRAAECYELGAWGNGKEPSSRDEHVKDRSEANATLGAKHSSFGVERDKIREP